jgi:hypothetical protein
VRAALGCVVPSLTFPSRLQLVAWSHCYYWESPTVAGPPNQAWRGSTFVPLWPTEGALWARGKVRLPQVLVPETLARTYSANGSASLESVGAAVAASLSANNRRRYHRLWTSQPWWGRNMEEKEYQS